MKKVSLLIVMTACISQLKAQTITIPKLADKQPNTQIDKNYQLKADSSLLKFTPGLHNDIASMLITDDINKGTIYSRMPVAALTSTDKIPNMNLGGRGTRYTMLIKRYRVVNPDNANSQKTAPTIIEKTNP